MQRPPTLVQNQALAWRGASSQKENKGRKKGRGLGFRLYWDNGKEKGKYHSGLNRDYMGFTCIYIHIYFWVLDNKAPLKSTSSWYLVSSR